MDFIWDFPETIAVSESRLVQVELADVGSLDMIVFFPSYS